MIVEYKQHWVLLHSDHRIEIHLVYNNVDVGVILEKSIELKRRLIERFLHTTVTIIFITSIVTITRIEEKFIFEENPMI